ncbi:hypothetical protein DPMN_036093 [Dreissena polymorpha]|uniref:HAT C-terminal dimerisation domain-containing protein n=1 Tax=Dreissena polymorpha TaxID=45954 RepID=A0A9D4M8T7_DREPO|nr:hypothetical protein DPMN_036093 [Dreissena polymorpha]
MYSFHRQRGELSLTDLFYRPEIQNSFPAVNYMFTLSRLIPSATASVERLFSLMNSLCTPSRNKLLVGTLDSLLRLCMEADLSESDVENVIDIFKKKDRDIAL